MNNKKSNNNQLLMTLLKGRTFIVLVLLVKIVDGTAGDLDRQNLCLCQQRQAQTQLDEPFHSLFSCRFRNVSGV